MRSPRDDVVVSHRLLLRSFFFFNDTATTEIYTLSLHDALPISLESWGTCPGGRTRFRDGSRLAASQVRRRHQRSEEHTSELQSPCNLVCRLLLEKKKNMTENQAHRRDSEYNHPNQPRNRERAR